MARASAEGVISGRLGGEAFVSAAPATVNPRTQKQMDARARLALAVRLWQTLPLDAMDRWRAYAANCAAFPLDGSRQRRRRGDLVFRGLSAKYLQVHGGSVVPTEPPASPFLGDGVVVTVSASPSSDGSFRRGGQGGEALPEPPPPGPLHQDEPLGGGGVLFTSLSSNSPGVLTELLLQRLAARHRQPHPEEYRTQRFVAFEAGSLTATVECPPGAYACAIRFVRSDTGQETTIVPLGVVEVA